MASMHPAQPELHILPSSPDIDQTAPPLKQRRTYYAYPEDDQAVALIRAKYGCSTESDAIRLALRLVAGDAIKVQTSRPSTRRIVVKFKARPTG